VGVPVSIDAFEELGLTSADQAVWGAALRQVEPPPLPPRKWPSPGAMAMALDPRSTRQTAMLEYIDRELVALADGQVDRLMVFCPPQEGKSQRVSRRFPAWLLSHDPTLRIAIVSYAANKAERWGRQIRRDILAHPELGIELRQDSRAAGRWETTQGGSLVAVGIDGGITGEPVDLLIVDDPVRGRAEAESSTYRETAWDWWESNGSTRLSSRGRTVLMMTRWNEADLAGRLLANEGDDWRVVRIPAIAEDDDPLGRQPGEELASVQQRKPGYFLHLKATRSIYVWLSIYMQTPTAAQGNIFRKLWWRYWHPAPDVGMGQRLSLGGRVVRLADCWRFATMDLANSTRTSADFTVVSAWAATLDGDLVLLDRNRARIGEAGHFGLARPLVERFKLDTVFVEESQFGTTLVREATSAGVPVSPLRADKDKLTRALPASAWCKAGRIWLPQAQWVGEEWVPEHASFPGAAHDDQVDTTSYAVRVLVTKAMPTPQLPQPRASSEMDFMSRPM
jgi:predicted phage terminase large subunit-like protein